MIKYRKPKYDHTAERKDVLTTLGIAAALHDTNEAVKQCALNLTRRCSDMIVRDLLIPLANSPTALTIITDEVLRPIKEKKVGVLYYKDFEYEIFVRWREVARYRVDDVVDLVAFKFLQRGILHGRISMTINRPNSSELYTTSVLMEDYVQRASQADRDAA